MVSDESRGYCLGIAFGSMRTAQEIRQRNTRCSLAAFAKDALESCVKIRSKKGVEQGIDERCEISDNEENVHSPQRERMPILGQDIDETDDEPEEPADYEHEKQHREKQGRLVFVLVRIERRLWRRTLTANQLQRVDDLGKHSRMRKDHKSERQEKAERGREDFVSQHFIYEIFAWLFFDVGKNANGPSQRRNGDDERAQPNGTRYQKYFLLFNLDPVFHRTQDSVVGLEGDRQYMIYRRYGEETVQYSR